MPEISPLDYAFLLLESDENPKHVGPVKILRPPEGAPADYVSRFVIKLRQQQPNSPFNYKLKAAVPNLLGVLPGIPSADLALPQWRAVSSVNMEKHVFHHLLPEPGSLVQLTQKVQELHQPLLNRSRPLWECHVIEGLDGGRRFAIYIKIHHSLADGVLLATRLITNTNSTPDPESGMVFWALPEGVAKPDHSENLIDDVSLMAKSLIKSSSMVGDMYMSVLRSGVGALLPKGSKNKKQRLPFTAPITQLDRQPGIGRSLAFGKLELARIKTLSKAVGATINDLLLTAVDMGVRRYLADSGAEPKQRMVALMPMSLRDKLDPSQANCVSAVTVNLGRADATPLERLRDISEETAEMKNGRELSAETTMANSLVLSGLAQLSESLNLVGSISPLGNFVFSNVPGAREARYQFDAQIEEIYPVSCLIPGSYMNITAYSYGAHIYMQFIALEKAAPNLNDLLEHVLNAVQELENAVFTKKRSVKVSAKVPDDKKPITKPTKSAVKKKPAKATAKKVTVVKKAAGKKAPATGRKRRSKL